MEIRIQTVTKAKTEKPDKVRPRIRITGKFLDEYGFSKDTLVSIKYSENSFVLKAEGKGMKTYGNIIKGLMKEGCGLTQVNGRLKSKKYIPGIQLCGKWLKDYGFDIGSIIALKYEYGLIKITALDINKIAVIV